MGLAVATVGVVIGLLALVGIVAPFRTLESIRSMRMPGRYYLAIVVLLGLGVLFILAAVECRTPRIVRALGGLLLLSGGVVAVMGMDRSERVVEWWLGRSALVASLGFASAAVLGTFLVYAGW